VCNVVWNTCACLTTTTYTQHWQPWYITTLKLGNITVVRAILPLSSWLTLYAHLFLGYCNARYDKSVHSSAGPARWAHTNLITDLLEVFPCWYLSNGDIEHYCNNELETSIMAPTLNVVEEPVTSLRGWYYHLNKSHLWPSRFDINNSTSSPLVNKSGYWTHPQIMSAVLAEISHRRCRATFNCLDVDFIHRPTNIINSIAFAFTGQWVLVMANKTQQKSQSETAESFADIIINCSIHFIKNWNW
jgi:hypothetical protein